ncbi:uncharacterized protein [Garra rufa]|uniref:uncharacterized protein n=1 Tax=Garra rufa TaxID=137080 RepID=UPI003CCE78DC
MECILLYDALGWEVSMPKDIHGLKGSCLVIPCSFRYKSNPPKNPRRAVWYQRDSKGSPLVYDPLHQNNVDKKFRGKTDLYGESDWDCSLLIKNLEPSHNGAKLYTRIDPENIAWQHFIIDDASSTVLVDATQEQPSISIYGGEKTGETITVECSAFHTCPYSKPTITLNGIEGADEIRDEPIKDGLWKITLTRTGVVKAERMTMLCSVTHYGGITVTATKDKSAECVHQKTIIEPELPDVIAGITKKFTCSVYHSCQKEPTITWNYNNMQVTMEEKTRSGLNWISYSNIDFMAAIEDNGKKLMCTAKFSKGNITTSVVLHVQRILLYDALGWEVSMPKDIHGLKGSCLVIPCSFRYKSSPPKNPRWVVWYQQDSKGSPLVYDPLHQNNIDEKFRGKTDLYGEYDWDCSLLIKNLQSSHNGAKLYTRIDPENIAWQNFIIDDATSTVLVDATPEKPSISIYGGERTGETITVVCSAFHTCPYSKPTLTLNGIEGSDEIRDESIKDDLWKITLTRTGVVKAEHLTIECSVTHHGGITVTATKDKDAECVHQKIMIEPELPDVTVGITKKFTCSVYHSCEKEPTITWNYKNMQVTMEEKTLSGLNWVSSSNIDFMASKEDNGKKLICTAKFSKGDITTSVVLHVQRVHQKIMIEPELPDVTVGIAKVFTCSVHHYCQKEPTITWNYKNMQVTMEKTHSGLHWISYSNISFLAAKEDNGKKLICTAKFSGGDITTSVVLHVQRILLYDALGWEVSMPKDIHGLKGSCLVIPCSFRYKLNPPQNPCRAVWYQRDSKGSPLVYDPLHPNNVNEKFSGKTDLYGESDWDCSLLIKNLEPSYNGEKLYARIDPENIAWQNYETDDATSTVLVDATPQQPIISIYGGERTGETITVECSAFHTCPYSKPTITLNGIEGSDEISDKSIKDGLWKITLTRTGVVKAESMTIQCSVTHHGGITVTATKDKIAKCVHQKIVIVPEMADVTVGIAKKFTCSVHHSCQKEPTITWNYKNMQVTTEEKTLSGLNWISYSNVAFLAAKEDHRKKLICTATFSGGDITTSVILHVQRVHQKIIIEPEMAAVTAGIAKKFTCSVYHSCQKEPTITWNYKNMQVTTEEKTLSGLNWISYSNIDFMAAKENHGKKLICTAKFSGGDITTSVVLHVQRILLYDALGWEVSMPKDIHGLKGSCLVIPCSFRYKSNPPKNPRRAVWYQRDSKGSPLVYDPLYPNNVDEKFRGKTDLYGESDWDCSLLIKNLEMFYNEEKLYTRIDPENIAWQNYEIDDATSTVLVDVIPQQPIISIYGGERTGETISVVCSAFHSCPYSKPTITLNGIEGTDEIKEESVKDGLAKITLTRTGVVKAVNLTINCLVTHYGGITVIATKDKIAECVHQKIMIEPEMADVTVGIAKKFTCSVHHSCQKEPTITWNYKNMQVTTEEKTLSGLNWISSSNIDFMASKEDHGKKLICTAKFSEGDITTYVVLHVQRVHNNISIEPELADVTEGIAKNFTCAVYHSCQQENPVITWNYENMQVSEWNKKHSDQLQISFSNITFLGAKEDNGKRLRCTAKFSGGNIETYVVLRVQEYQKPVDQILNETYFQYVADVIPKITALPRSCVVIPCSFKSEDEFLTRLRVLWVDRKGGYMFHTDPVDVLDNFKGRTRLLGNPDEQNCTVEIDNVQTHDNGPFCFQAERENERYSFNNSCVFIIMRAPDKPVMSSLPEDIEPGTRVTVKCSVNHTCSSHPPEITWSIPTARETVSHNHMGGGIWETVSAVTFIPTGYEEKDEIVCTAKYWGGKTQENPALISIRRIKLETVGLYAIAPSLVFILICVLAGVLICKRRHRQPRPYMQGSHTPSEQRSVWNRFSSRFSMPEGKAAWTNRGNRIDIGNAPERPPKPEQRRSIWSRFSRHQSPRTNANLRAEYKANNTCMVLENKPFSKPYVPPPKRVMILMWILPTYMEIPDETVTSCALTDG